MFRKSELVSNKFQASFSEVSKNKSSFKEVSRKYKKFELVSNKFQARFIKTSKIMVSREFRATAAACTSLSLLLAACRSRSPIYNTCNPWPPPPSFSTSTITRSPTTEQRCSRVWFATPAANYQYCTVSCSLLDIFHLHRCHRHLHACPQPWPPPHTPVDTASVGNMVSSTHIRAH